MNSPNTFTVLGFNSFLKVAYFVSIWIFWLDRFRYKGLDSALGCGKFVSFLWYITEITVHSLEILGVSSLCNFCSCSIQIFCSNWSYFKGSKSMNGWGELPSTNGSRESLMKSLVIHRNCLMSQSLKWRLTRTKKNKFFLVKFSVYRGA